jgi:hypothetical protein
MSVPTLTALAARVAALAEENPQLRLALESRIVRLDHGARARERDSRSAARIQQRHMEPPPLAPERVATVAATFREANERIELAAHNTALAGPIPFICECADAACTAIVRLTLEQYENVRAHPHRFVTLRRHETLAVDAGAARIVTAAEHTVLELTGVAATIAAQDYNAA